MPKFTVYVEIKSTHSYTGEFANEQEAYDYAQLVNQKHDIQKLDGWKWDDEVFEVYEVREAE